ncbi:MAG: hypothetical protein ABW275_12130 [Hansschlegelia sp.]
MRRSLRKDGMRIVAASVVWALVGAVALSLADDMAVTGSICVGWLIGYGVMIAMLARRNSHIPTVLGVAFVTFALFGYGFAVLMGVGSGTD